MTGIFDNDGALDWLTDFSENPEEVKIISAFRMTGDAADYPDALDCEEALAAAAVVISLINDAPNAGLPIKFFDELKLTEFVPSSKLIPDALKSCKHILTKSELKDLWEEDESYAEWELTVKELILLLQT